MLEALAQRYARRLGFTLTEVLVAVIVIAILAAMAVANYGKTIGQARWDTARSILVQIYDGEQKYLSTVAEGESYYPPGGGVMDGTTPTSNWRNYLYMDNPNTGGSVTYSLTTVGNTKFTATATFNKLDQTIDQDRQFGAGDTWPRP